MGIIMLILHKRKMKEINDDYNNRVEAVDEWTKRCKREIFELQISSLDRLYMVQDAVWMDMRDEGYDMSWYKGIKEARKGFEAESGLG